MPGPEIKLEAQAANQGMEFADPRQLAEAVIAELQAEGTTGKLEPGLNNLAMDFKSAIDDLNSGRNAQSKQGFSAFADRLKSALIKAYESGGLSELERTYKAIDQSIEGKGNGIFIERRGESLRVSALRPVDERVAQVLDKAGEPSNGSFRRIQQGWYETLVETQIDLSALKPDGQISSDFEKSSKTGLEKAGSSLAEELKADFTRYGGKGISEALMSELSKYTSLSQGRIQEHINGQLSGSGLSVKLEFRDGINGLHGDTVEQTVVEVKVGETTIARQLQQYDTVRSWNSQGELKSEETGIIRAAESSNEPRFEKSVGIEAPGTEKESAPAEILRQSRRTQAYVDAIDSLVEHINVTDKVRMAAQTGLLALHDAGDKLTGFLKIEQAIRSVHPHLSDTEIRLGRALAFKLKVEKIDPELKLAEVLGSSTSDKIPEGVSTPGKYDSLKDMRAALAADAARAAASDDPHGALQELSRRTQDPRDREQIEKLASLPPEQRSRFVEFMQSGTAKGLSLAVVLSAIVGAGTLWRRGQKQSEYKAEMTFKRD